MRNILVTNALPYANGHLHLGHMLGYVQSDIWVRYQKMKGNNCYFVCGSDTHGTPIMLRANKENITPEQLVNNFSKSHENDFNDFHIKFDNYHSTHNDLNKKLVQSVYLKLKEKGLIEKKIIQQCYDPEAKMFLPDRFIKGDCPKCNATEQYGDNCEVCSATYSPIELKNAVSVVTGKKPILKESEHYFFKLSRVQKDVKYWLDNANLQKEVKNKLNEWLDSGLQDWDISRDSPYFGYEIPDTNGKYFYVWLDAPIGYIAAFFDMFDKLGLDKNKYLSADSTSELYHFIGKDIIYFHALFWPALLKSSDYKMPNGVFANGFLTINGKKMSKSRGTFISAKTYLNHLDPVYLRYYFASKLSTKIDDIDLNLNDFIAKVNSDLVGKLINIASRCSGFLFKKFDKTLSIDILEDDLLQVFINSKIEIEHDYENREFSSAIRKIMHLTDLANQFVEKYKPWSLAKEEGSSELVHKVCSQAINLFKILITYLKPIVPSLAEKVEIYLNINLKWDNIEKPLLNVKLNKFEPLLQRIIPEKIKSILEDTKLILESEAELNKSTITKDKNITNELPLPEIDFSDFMKVDLRIAKILEATNIEKSNKLLKIIVDIDGVKKQVIAGIKTSYNPEDLIGKMTVIVANLAPRKMKFGISEAMILVADNEIGMYILSPDSGATSGMRVK